MTLFSIFLTTGCSNETEGVSIDGVNGSVEINLGESFNALEGISATNEKGKDISDEIIVEFDPYVLGEDGIFTPQESGDYIVRYSLKNHPEVMETGFFNG